MKGDGMILRRFPLGFVIPLLCWGLVLRLSAADQAKPAPLIRGVSATVHPQATEAALRMFEGGGNAVDAAVAAALMLGVVDGHNSGLGGGCFLLIRLGSGETVALDGRETAPARAHRDLFLREGKADPDLSQTGALAVAVPGALAAYAEAVQRHGRLPLAKVIEPSIQAAQAGFMLTADYARRLREAAEQMRRFEETRRIFLQPTGEAWPAGHLLKQPDLSTAYQAIAREGPDWFYRGPFARATAEWMRREGGLITEADLRDYRVKLRTPIRTTYRGWEILGFPPPSSGGVHVAQILNILEAFDLRRWGAGSADLIHVMAEAMKLAFADRAHWLGDPAFAPVPRGLASKEYARELAGRIRLDQAATVSGAGEPAHATTEVFDKHTTHFATADSEGNWVACTATINTSFGAKVVVPGTGILLNNEMDDFSAQPGTANFFGLVGAEANAIAPGKRPLSSMSPTIVLKEGKPVFSVGAAGGPTIISQVVLALVYTLDFGLPPDAALAQARFHHQWKPDELVVERTLPEEVVKELERRGHHVRRVDALGATQAIAVGRETDQWQAVREPRLEGKAGPP